MYGLKPVPFTLKPTPFNKAPTKILNQKKKKNATQK